MKKSPLLLEMLPAVVHAPIQLFTLVLLLFSFSERQNLYIHIPSSTHHRLL
jgi:hypothetical protein